MIRIEIPGLPPSVNKIAFNTVRGKAKVSREYKADVQAVVWELGLGELALGTKLRPIRVEIAYVLGPKRRNSDTLNREKVLIDALTTSGVLADDRYVKIAEIVSVWGPEDRTLVKLFAVQPPTLEQVLTWWDLPDPHLVGSAGSPHGASHRENDMIELLNGDSLQILKSRPDNSADSIVCDPPAGIGFMEQEWDTNKGGRLQWIAWLAAVMAEALRVLKPGGHALIWALPKTSHWTMTALEEAGFEIRDVIMHVFGQGMPHGPNIGKQIDKHLGAERPVIEMRPQRGAKFKLAADTIDNGGFNDPNRKEYAVTAPATEEAKRYEGWGTLLKPGYEAWILCRKPIATENIATNVLQWSTGGLNIPGCSVAKDRWPANLILSHSPVCDDEACVWWCPVRELDQQSGIRTSGSRREGVRKGMGYHGASGDGGPAVIGDTGGASRFFYCPKPSPREKEAGLDDLPAKVTDDGRKVVNDTPYQRGKKERKNHHPTVKATALMRYLCRLITPPGGIVLDPFMGSGSTGIAAIQEGFGFLGIELSSEYFEIARRRIEHQQNVKQAS